MPPFRAETHWQRMARDYLLRSARSELLKEVDAYGAEIEEAKVIRPHGKAGALALRALQFYAIRTGRMVDVGERGRVHFEPIPRSESELEERQ